MFTHTFAAMTTRCELQFHGVTPELGQAVAQQIQARVASLVKRYNFHAADSWLNTAINERRGPSVVMDAECAAVLSLVREHAQHTQGAFDITVGTYAARLRLARTSQEAHKVRQQLAHYTGHQHWHIDGDVLHIDNPITRFDLGGVIKEYAVDESARIAQAAGIPAGIVNYGGDLHTWGLKPDQQRFVAAIPDPRQPERMLFGLDLQNQALTTSGHYARHRAIKGGVLSHVITPASPQPLPPPGQRWLSVSVVSPSALISGIYSTALLVRDDLSLPDQTFAVAVDQHGQVHPLHSNDMSRIA